MGSATELPLLVCNAKEILSKSPGIIQDPGSGYGRQGRATGGEEANWPEVIHLMLYSRNVAGGLWTYPEQESNEALEYCYGATHKKNDSKCHFAFPRQRCKRSASEFLEILSLVLNN